MSQSQLEKPKYIWEEDILEFGVRSRGKMIDKKGFIRIGSL